MAEFEWDPQKEVINVRKHGFDFATASHIWNAKLWSGSTTAGTMEKRGSSQPDESTR
jgi:uncharacterized DUF497 family protein